ncbi:MAG: ribosome biogenesis GTPase Der [Acidobacteria bacterium]|nr:ribosome biogenesis GTPase Der [Acidobacteriota bacterium]
MARSESQKTVLSEFEDRHLPVVALVGRPNVGKSTMFNRMTRSRRAIVDAKPGMTRDRLYGSVELDSGRFRLVDTGGIEIDPDRIAQMIRGQTESAIVEAAVVVFMTDGREGLLPSDRSIADALRSLGKPVVVFVNKIDRDEGQMTDTDVYGLGFETVVFGSAEHNLNISTLEEWIADQLQGQLGTKAESGTEVLRLAIIGRPNAGKSSIVNRLLGEERVLVSDVAGTTRDPIDSFLTYQNRSYCLVDTAGIRRRGKIEGSPEQLSVMMASRQVEQADVIVVVIDASEPVASQDAAIAGIANGAYRPVIIAVNKWDLVPNKETNTAKDFEDRIRRKLKFLERTPFVFISAQTGQRVTKLLELAHAISERSRTRVTTGVLNRFVGELDTQKSIPPYKGKRVKIYYMTQVDVNPPTFIATANVRSLHFSQERFLLNRIRDAFNLHGIPIRLVLRAKLKR